MKKENEKKKSGPSGQVEQADREVSPSGEVATAPNGQVDKRAMRRTSLISYATGPAVCLMEGRTSECIVERPNP